MTPFARKPGDRIAALGETRLIAAIRRWLGAACPPAPAGIGDDCAVLPPARSRQLLTVDPVVLGRHFDASVPPRAVGAKLLKRNLSDIAAMGGLPRVAVVSLVLDRRVSRRWLEGFHRGLAAAARRHGVAVVGGDVAEAPGALTATLTLLGEAGGRRVLTRRGARTGDGIIVTGLLGASRRTGHHHRFQPRLEEGRWLAGRPEVRAMMDVSDGLGKDLAALTPAGARAELDPAAVPRRAGCPLRAALGDGEDYELVAVLAAGTDRNAFRAAWRRRFPRVRLSFIGRFVPLRGGGKGERGGTGGYEHFR